MNENEFAQKIIKILDEKPISKEVESRLFNARQAALKAYSLKHTHQAQTVNANVINIHQSGSLLSMAWSGNGKKEFNIKNLRSSIFILLIGLFLLISLTSFNPNAYRGYNTDPNSLADLDMQILTDERPIEFWLTKDKQDNNKD